MGAKSSSAIYRQPSYIINAEGKPEAVVIDISTWHTILEWLEDVADRNLFLQAMADLEALTKGHRPAGWQSWEEFEAELAHLETTGELQD